MSKPQPYKTQSSKIAFESKWIRVYEDKIIHPNGQTGEFFVVEQPPGDGVWIVALNNKNEICLVRQYRYPHKELAYEIPGGFSDHQEPLVAAKRELREETGYEAMSWQHIGRLRILSGATRVAGDIFVARDLKQTYEHEQAEEGIIAVNFYSLAKILTMIDEGNILEATSIAIVMKTMLRLKLSK